MTHTPHSLTVSLNYTKQPGKICRSYKKKKNSKKEWEYSVPRLSYILDLEELQVMRILRFCEFRTSSLQHLGMC